MAVGKKRDLIKDQKRLPIFQGVEKLKIMGFSNITIANSLTDDIYHLYFLNNMSNSKNEKESMVIKELRSLITKLFRF